MLFTVHRRRVAADGGGPPWVVVLVAGDLDMATAPRLRQEVLAALAAGDRHVVVDLAGVEVCDSVGLGVLIGLLKRLRSHGGDLRFAGVPASLSATLDLVGLSDALPLFPDVESATATTPVETGRGA